MILLEEGARNLCDRGITIESHICFKTTPPHRFGWQLARVMVVVEDTQSTKELVPFPHTTIKLLRTWGRDTTIISPMKKLTQIVVQEVSDVHCYLVPRYLVVLLLIARFKIYL